MPRDTPHPKYGTTFDQNSQLGPDQMQCTVFGNEWVHLGLQSYQAQDPQLKIWIQKHGPEVEPHHSFTSQWRITYYSTHNALYYSTHNALYYIKRGREGLGLTLVHEVLSGSPHSSESCSDLCWSSCAWADWRGETGQRSDGTEVRLQLAEPLRLLGSSMWFSNRPLEHFIKTQNFW